MVQISSCPDILWSLVLEVYNFRDVIHVDFGEYSFLSNWLLRSSTYENNHLLVFKLGNHTIMSVFFFVWCLLARTAMETGFLKPGREAESTPTPPSALAPSTFLEADHQIPQNLIITPPRSLYKFWLLKVFSHQCFYKLECKFILKTLSCVIFVFLLMFYLNINILAFL